MDLLIGMKDLMIEILSTEISMLVYVMKGNFKPLCDPRPRRVDGKKIIPQIQHKICLFRNKGNLKSELASNKNFND
jgi:hypothetical protein